MATALLALDLDGTLLRSDRSISPHSLAVLRRARDAGLHVVIVTGRPPRFLDALPPGLGEVAICCNGALVYEIATRKTLHHRPLAAALARAVVAHMAARVPGTVFGIERGLTFGYEPKFASLSADKDVPGAFIAPVAELCAEGLTKLLVGHPTASVTDLVAAIAGSGLALSVTHSGAPFAEVAAADVTKAAALAHLCDRLGIPASHVTAFGDMPNDLPMMRLAGRAVAVANAHPDVLAAAHEITGTNNDDGVAASILRLLADRADASA